MAFPSRSVAETVFSIIDAGSLISAVNGCFVELRSMSKALPVRRLTAQIERQATDAVVGEIVGEQNRNLGALVRSRARRAALMPASLPPTISNRIVRNPRDTRNSYVMSVGNGYSSRPALPEHPMSSISRCKANVSSVASGKAIKRLIRLSKEAKASLKARSTSCGVPFIAAGSGIPSELSSAGRAKMGMPP